MQRDRLQQREQLIQQYLRQERREHSHILNRKAVIEARKEKIESLRNKLVSFSYFGHGQDKFEFVLLHNISVDVLIFLGEDGVVKLQKYLPFPEAIREIHSCI